MLQFLKWFVYQGVTKRSSQQGSRGGDQGPNVGGQQQPPPRREIRLQTSIARMERKEEDPNVWKPKHAVKSKESDPDKIVTEVHVE